MTSPGLAVINRVCKLRWKLPSTERSGASGPEQALVTRSANAKTKISRFFIVLILNVCINLTSALFAYQSASRA